MTVSQPYAPLSFECTGETTRFQVSWPFMTPRDLIVSLVDGEQQRHPLKIETHFKVDGKAVVLNEAPPVGCVVLVARRTMPIQPIELKNKDTETALDRVVLVVQENFARAQGEDGLSLAIHQADIDKAVEAYLEAMWPALKVEVQKSLADSLRLPEAQETPPQILYAEAPEEIQEFLVEAANQVTGLKQQLGDLAARVAQQDKLIQALELNNEITIEAMAIQDDDHPNIGKYPVFAQACGLRDTSSKDDWDNAINQFRRRA